MLKQMRDYSPDAAKAIDNLITLCNPGYDLNCFYASQTGDDGEPVVDEEGLKLLEAFSTRICSEYSGAWDGPQGKTTISGKASHYPGLDTFSTITHLTVATQGAMAAEIELTEDLKDVVDVYPVDPSYIDFRIVDPVANRIVPGLNIQGPFTPLDPLRFRYIGKDPDIYQPAGRSPMLAALDIVFFQQQFMRELQAVAHMTNSPRIDISVAREMAEASLKNVRSDLLAPGQEENLKAFLDGYLSDIQNVISNLEVDDAFVHFDTATATFVSPGNQAMSVKDLMDVIDAMIISGLKQLPILLGRNEGATTTHATVQWQVFVKQLGGYQHISRSLIVWALNFYLRLMGRQSYATFEYHEHKTTDELVDAQTLNVRMLMMSAAVDRGWITDNEASRELFGHDANGTPVPLAVAPTNTPQGATKEASQVISEVHQGEAEMKRAALTDADALASRRLARGGRGISPRVTALPTWLQLLHHDAADAYDRWRSDAVLPRFHQAILQAGRDPATNTLDDKGLAAWLTERLTLPDQAEASLAATLTSQARHAATVMIGHHLASVGISKPVRLTDAKLLERLDTRAGDSAWSVVQTFNADLALAIAEQVTATAPAQEGRGLGSDLVSAASRVKEALAGLLTWENARNVWKEAQVGLAETQAAISDATREFFTNNTVEGEAEVQPRVCAEPVCQSYVDGNPYESMDVLLANCELPAHLGCPHFAQMVGGARVLEPVWAGGG